MQGLTLASLRKHPSLIPLYVCVGGGVVWAGYYLGRLCLRCPDVGWKDKAEGNLPNTKWPINKQYKFYAPNTDYSKLKFPEERPEI